jgi:hypothetical protein
MLTCSASPSTSVLAIALPSFPPALPPRSAPRGRRSLSHATPDPSRPCAGDSSEGWMSWFRNFAFMPSPQDDAGPWIRRRVSGPAICRHFLHARWRSVLELGPDRVLSAGAHDQSLEFGEGDFRARRADCRIDVPMDRLAAGQYLLEIEAAAGDDRDNRTLRFSVR